MIGRRQLLACVCAAFAGASAGCLDGTAGSDAPGTADLPTRLWFERVELSDAERRAADPIVFADLPGAERAIVTSAFDAGEYTVDSEETSPALDSLRHRIEQRADGGLEVYLRRDGTYYRVGFAAGDHIVAHPDQ